jgi:hypothetical protein
MRAVLYGVEGIGKSTLASKFPKPLFIDIEGSTDDMDVARLDRPSSWQMLLSQIEWVKNNPDVCNTLVIDTADWAEKLCVNHLCAKYNKTGLENFGYGTGYTYLEEEFGRLLNVLSDVAERDVNVVLTAHACIKKFEQPDETGSYDRWQLKLEKKTAPLVKEWAKMVLFCNYKTIVINVDNQGASKGKNKAQGGKRVIYTTHHPCWDAKNRHDLPDEIPMDYAAIAHCIPSRNAVAPQQVAQPVTQPAPQQSAPEPIAQPEPQPMPDAPVQQQAAPINDLEAEGVPKALADLMRASDVTLDEIHAAIVAKKYFPPNTPFRNYPKDFVEGALIGAWPQVLQVIEQNRVPF